MTWIVSDVIARSPRHEGRRDDLMIHEEIASLKLAMTSAPYVIPDSIRKPFPLAPLDSNFRRNDKYCLRINSLLFQPHRLRQAQHQVHVLNCLAGAAFNQIIDAADNNQSVGSWVYYRMY